jgi:mannonate dehydratase
MKRRTFLAALPLFGLAAAGGAAARYWPEQGFTNQCLAKLPDAIAQHELIAAAWSGLSAAHVWDCHTHLVGSGDSGSGAWFSPDMDSLWHPLLHLQKLFYLNAGCIHEAPGQMDLSYVARMRNLIEGMRPGYKAMLLAFDWHHDEQGRPQKEHSIFHIPDSYAASLAHQFPAQFEWVASIHPYREDAIPALHAAIKDGARAIKWLPSAMGIDPLSPRCDRYYEILAASGLPIISHAGREMAVQGGTQDYGNPLRLRRALDHGVRVVIAHCASDGDDQDMDGGINGPVVRSYDLFARMMDEPRYQGLLFGDISALTQRNRAWALKLVLQRSEWHARLLNGSDYPLPGVMPLFAPSSFVAEGLLPAAAVPVLHEIRHHNPLLFDFVLKRSLRLGEQHFPASVFETRRFFERGAK